MKSVQKEMVYRAWVAATVLQKRTGWSYSECLRCVRDYTAEQIEVLIKAREAKEVISAGLCTCECHAFGSEVMHVMACCNPCFADCGELHVVDQKAHATECLGGRDRRTKRGKPRWVKGQNP